MPSEAHFTTYLWVFGAGCLLGLIFAAMGWFRLLSAKGEAKKLRLMLGERMEIESTATSKLRNELESLRKQNENLRIKVAELNQNPERRLQRELEILARAEKIMTSTSPGFPAVWESAKKTAYDELAVEETGNTLPKRIFQKFTALTPSAKAIEQK
ncbi:MAG TPA: hypothetical protein VIT21_08590 [Chthoniobacterales bacterium]